MGAKQEARPSVRPPRMEGYARDQTAHIHSLLVRRSILAPPVRRGQRLPPLAHPCTRRVRAPAKLRASGRPSFAQLMTGQGVVLAGDRPRKTYCRAVGRTFTSTLTSTEAGSNPLLCRPGPGKTPLHWHPAGFTFNHAWTP